MQKGIKTIAAIAICLIANGIYAGETNKHSNVITFGDSLGDVGNNHWLASSGQVGAPYTNEDTTTHKRPIWMDFLVDSIQPGSVTYHSSQVQSEHINPVVDSVSYAWASAETSAHYVNDDQKLAPFPTNNDDVCIKHGPGYIEKGNVCVPGVRQQVELYLKDVHYHPNPNTIFIFTGDDVENNTTRLIATGRSLQAGLFASLSLTDDNQSGFTDLAYPMINFMKAKNDLIDAGVSPDHIFVIDLADVAQMPGVIKLEKTYPGILKLMHAVSVSFNANLNKAMTSMNPRYDLPASNVISSYSFLNDVIANSAKYGFTNATEGCVDNQAGPLCAGYMFYDGKHATNKLNKIFVEQIKNKF